jgi:tetratricopeptide (TPR) repeat protein
LLTALGGLGGAYLLQQHHEREARFARAFTEARTLANKAHEQAGEPAPWRDALAAIDRVEGRGHEAEAAALRAEIQRGLVAAERLAKLRQDLVEVRAHLEDSGPAGTDAAYDAVFRAAGLDLDALSPAGFARGLEGLPGRAATELAAFLDDWAAVRRLARRPVAAWRKPLEAARRADPDPYRDRLRAALLTEDLGSKAEALRALAAAPEAAGLPAATTGLLGQALANAGQAEAAVALLRQAAVQYPDDVWVNYILAEVLNGRGPSARAEAVRYYTAARVLRPATAHALAHLLARMGRGAEAEAVFRDLAGRRPEDPRHFACLGNHLKEGGRAAAAATSFERAIAAGRAALRLRPDDAPAHYDVGRALSGLGRREEAAAECRTALRLRPDYAEAHYILGHVLEEQGKPGEAAAELRAAIRLEPDLTEAHYNLGNVLGGLGQADEAAAEFRTAIRQRPDYAQAHSNLGLILRQQGKHDEAAAEFRAAIRSKPDLSEAHTNLANALAEQGKRDEAVAVLRTAVRTMPDDAPAHCLLGLLLRDQGDFDGSLAELRKGHELGMRQPGWPYPSARWVTEVERLAKLTDRLPAVIRGEDRPRDGAERLTFARMAYDTKRYAAAARLWAEALDADPKLADDLRAQHRYAAACAAALAGCGQGRDDPPPDDAARARLRGQALDWLRADLALRTKQLDTDATAARNALAHWKVDADLAGVRDPAALAALSGAERDAWRALWAEVDRLLLKSGNSP